MDGPSTSTASANNRQKRILPSRSRRGGPGVGHCEIDNLILETQKRKSENEPLIPADTRFLLTTNPRYAEETSEGGIQINVVANDRYFDRPEVLKSFREQSIIQTPDFEAINDSISGVGGRFRPRNLEEAPAETSDAAYEKRHRKFEAFEKRQRTREKEKLKHEHYKLKERIEQLRGMEGAAFMNLPASSFSAPPKEHPVSDTEEPLSPLAGGPLNAEGERRRREMLDIAFKLERRYSYLLPPDRVRKAPEQSAPTAGTSKDTESRDEDDSDAERFSSVGTNKEVLKVRIPGMKSSGSTPSAQSPAPFKPTIPKKARASTSSASPFTSVPLPKAPGSSIRVQRERPSAPPLEPPNPEPSPPTQQPPLTNDPDIDDEMTTAMSLFRTSPPLSAGIHSDPASGSALTSAASTPAESPSRAPSPLEELEQEQEHKQDPEPKSPAVEEPLILPPVPETEKDTEQDVDMEPPTVPEAIVVLEKEPSVDLQAAAVSPPKEIDIPVVDEDGESEKVSSEIEEEPTPEPEPPKKALKTYAKRKPKPSATATTQQEAAEEEEGGISSTSRFTATPSLMDHVLAPKKKRGRPTMAEVLARKARAREQAERSREASMQASGTTSAEMRDLQTRMEQTSVAGPSTDVQQQAGQFPGRGRKGKEKEVTPAETRPEPVILAPDTPPPEPTAEPEPIIIITEDPSFESISTRPTKRRRQGKGDVATAPAGLAVRTPSVQPSDKVIGSVPTVTAPVRRAKKLKDGILFTAAMRKTAAVRDVGRKAFGTEIPIFADEEFELSTELLYGDDRGDWPSGVVPPGAEGPGERVNGGQVAQDEDEEMTEDEDGVGERPLPVDVDNLAQLPLLSKKIQVEEDKQEGTDKVLEEREGTELVDIESVQPLDEDASKLDDTMDVDPVPQPRPKKKIETGEGKEGEISERAASEPSEAESEEPPPVPPLSNDLAIIASPASSMSKRSRKSRPLEDD